MEFRLQTLSPVHIRSGREIEPFEYVVERGQYYRVNLDAFMERAYEMDAGAPEKLSAWITETTRKIEDRKEQTRRAERGQRRDYNQQLSELRGMFNLLHFCDSHPEYKNIRGPLLAGNGLSYYHCPTNVGRERGQIREQIKTADLQPYVPGSSIKGAIRTALSHLILAEMGPDDPLKAQIRDGVMRVIRRAEEVRNTRERNKLKENAGTDLENLIFMCGLKTREGVSYNDVHYDLMKVVSISDTYNPNARFISPQVHTFLKQRLRDGGSRLAAQVQILMEALDANSDFGIRVEVDTAFLKRASRMRYEKDWIGLPEKFQRIFGFALPDAERMSDKEVESKIVLRIQEACHKHARAVAAEELKWIERFPDETRRLRDFYKGFQGLPESITPLRIGWGSHFMTTTLLLAFRDDRVLRPTLEKLIKVFELDLTGNQKQSMRDPDARQVKVDEFPRSRRLVSVNEMPAAPFGWIALRLPDAPPVEPLVDMAALMAEQRTEPEPRRGPSGFRGRSERPSGTRPREQRPQTRFEAPPRRAEPLPAIPKSLPKPEPKAQGRPKIREGQQVSAEVLSYEGGVVRVRLTGAAGEELEFRAFRAFRIGDKIKVKVDSLDAAGKVTKVRL